MPTDTVKGIEVKVAPGRCGMTGYQFSKWWRSWCTAPAIVASCGERATEPSMAVNAVAEELH